MISGLRQMVLCSLLVSVLLSFSAYSAAAGQGSIRISVFPPSELAVLVDFKDSSGDEFLGAGESGTLVVSVINNGKTVSKNVSANITSDRAKGRLMFPGRVRFGDIAAGKIVKRTVDVRADKDISPGKVNLNISVSDSNGFESGIIDVTIGLKASRNPKLVVHDYGINDRTNDLKIEPKERIVLVVRIKNAGGGIARNVRVEINYGKDVTICGSGITSFDIGEIKPGRYEDIKFNFYADESIKRGERIPIGVIITEERPENGSSVPLDIRMFAPQKRSDSLRG